jgi:hypothetical protein
MSGKIGRPRMSESEKLVAISARMQPGDVEKLVAAGQRRGLPTSSYIRDLLHAVLVLADEPGAFVRAGLAGWAVELGLDQEPDAGAPRSDAAAAARGRGDRLGTGPRASGQTSRRARAS